MIVGHTLKTLTPFYIKKVKYLEWLNAITITMHMKQCTTFIDTPMCFLKVNNLAAVVWKL